MIAHCLTAIRLILAVPVALGMARPDLAGPWLILMLLVIAIASDFLDGAVARRMGTASSVGQIFDHSTDCLFVSVSLAGAAYAGLSNVLLPPLVLLAFAQYVLDSRFFYRIKSLRMSFIGRWNGIFYFSPLLLFAIGRLLDNEAGLMLLEAGYWLTWLLVLSTLTSIIDRAMAPLLVSDT